MDVGALLAKHLTSTFIGELLLITKSPESDGEQFLFSLFIMKYFIILSDNPSAKLGNLIFNLFFFLNLSKSI